MFDTYNSPFNASLSIHYESKNFAQISEVIRKENTSTQSDSPTTHKVIQNFTKLISQSQHERSSPSIELKNIKKIAIEPSITQLEAKITVHNYLLKELALVDSELLEKYNSLGSNLFKSDTSVKLLQEKRKNIQSDIDETKKQILPLEILNISKNQIFSASINKFFECKDSKKNKITKLFITIENATKEHFKKTNPTMEDMIPTYEAALLAVQVKNPKLYEHLVNQLIMIRPETKPRDQTAHWCAFTSAGRILKEKNIPTQAARIELEI